jgi:hypothetical protein
LSSEGATRQENTEGAQKFHLRRTPSERSAAFVVIPMIVTARIPGLDAGLCGED